MKKLLTVLFVLLMVISLSACSKKEPVVEEPEIEPLPEVKDDYASYVAANLEDEVEVYMSVQAHQSWWEDNGVGKCTIYGQDDDGAYFVYESHIDEETANALVPGTLIKVKGYKSEWSGEVEIADGEVEVIAGGYEGKVYEAKDVTADIGTDKLIDSMNQKIMMKGLEVVALSKKDSEWDPDLYITVKSGDTQFDCCVENYLTKPDTEVYKAVEALEVGSTIDIEGFLYWYEGANPHVTAVTVK